MPITINFVVWVTLSNMLKRGMSIFHHYTFARVGGVHQLPRRHCAVGVGWMAIHVYRQRRRLMFSTLCYWYLQDWPCTAARILVFREVLNARKGRSRYKIAKKGRGRIFRGDISCALAWVRHRIVNFIRRSYTPMVLEQCAAGVAVKLFLKG